MNESWILRVTAKRQYLAPVLVLLLILGMVLGSVNLSTASSSHQVYVYSRPAEGGVTSPSGSLGTKKHGDKFTVTATANQNYIFVGWSDCFINGGVKNNERILFSNDNTLTSYQVPAPSDHAGDYYLYAEFGHEIKATAGTGGSINPSGEVKVRHGESKTFNITPNSGYLIDQILVNSVPVTVTDPSGMSYTFTNVTNDQKIDVTFARYYTITATAGEGGSIDPSGAVKVREHQDKSFTITPNEGYHIDDVLVDDISVGAGASYTFYDVQADHTIRATFAPTSYLLTTQANPMAGGTVSAGGTYAPGSEVQLSATPAEGYAFVNWTEGETVVSESASFTYIMPARDVTLTAHFALTYTITAWVYGGNGSISPSGSVKVVHGSSQTFTFIPNVNYGVKSITVDGNINLSPRTSYTFEYVTSNHTIVVSFQPSFARGLVSVTMDDGKLSQYNNAKPVLDACGIKATLFPLPCYNSNPSQYPGYMSVQQLLEFKNAGHEIGSHTYNHKDLTQLDETGIRNELETSKTWLENNGLGPVTSFAAPFGTYNDTTIQLIKEYYGCQRITDGGYNLISNFNKYKILVKKVANTTTITELRSWLDYAKASKSWLVLMYHNIEEGTGDLYVTPANFAVQMQAIVDSGVPEMTFKEALDELAKQIP